MFRRFKRLLSRKQLLNKEEFNVYVDYVGTIEEAEKRGLLKDLELVMNDLDVEEIRENILHNHPDIQDFQGFFTNPYHYRPLYGFDGSIPNNWKRLYNIDYGYD